VWHASISYTTNKRRPPVPMERWGAGVWNRARQLLRETLEGVGRGETVEEPINAILHHRRGLSDDEIALLSAEWLAIPATDEFSPGGRVESRL